MYKTLDTIEVYRRLFIDLTKAFDMVNLDICIRKLDAYGIRGIAYQWFVSYLKNRKLLVKIDCLDVTTDEVQQKQLEERIIEYRVPQDSSLGLLLFLIYINDIDTNVSSVIGIRLTLFADDTSILITGEDMQYLIFNLSTISWSILPQFDENKFIINKDKSLAFGFHHKWNKHVVFPDVMLKGSHITYVSKITFLGA